MEILHYEENREKAFLGRGWKFPVQFNWQTKSVKMSVAEEDIEESLFILLNTIKKERLMRPEFGCNLMPMVYENMDNSLYSALKDDIKNAITLYESRIEVANIRLDEEMREGVIYIEVEYIVRITNSRQNLVFPFYVTQGTEIDNFERIHDQQEPS